MASVSRQGIINTNTGSTLCEALPGKELVVINMRFTCSSAYTLTIKRYNHIGVITSTLYELTLNAGDTVTDTFEYLLTSGDKIIASSDTSGVVYIITAKE